MAQSITMEDVLQSKDNAMVDEKNRLASFKKWPFKKGTCTKEQMAQAGFYKCNIKGELDSVRCFVCFEPLDGWEEDDLPFSEHIRHSPNCAFAKFQKSQEDLCLSDWISVLQERNTNLNNLRLNKKIQKLEASFQSLMHVVNNVEEH